MLADTFPGPLLYPLETTLVQNFDVMGNSVISAIAKFKRAEAVESFYMNLFYIQDILTLTQPTLSINTYSRIGDLSAFTYVCVYSYTLLSGGSFLAVMRARWELRGQPQPPASWQEVEEN